MTNADRGRDAFLHVVASEARGAGGRSEKVDTKVRQTGVDTK